MTMAKQRAENKIETGKITTTSRTRKSNGKSRKPKMRYLAIICYVALRCSFSLVFTIQVDKIDLNWCVFVCMCCFLLDATCFIRRI